MQHLWNEWASLLTVCGIKKAREGRWIGYKGDAEMFLQEITSLAETAQRVYWLSKPGLKRLAVHKEFG